MGRIDRARLPPGRGLGLPAGWIVAAGLAVVLVALVAFLTGKRSGADRGAPAAVASVPLVAVSPALTSAAAPAPSESQVPTSAPAAPQEGRIESAAMDVTNPGPSPERELAREPNGEPKPAPVAPPVSRASTGRACPDQAAVLLPKLEPLIFEFKREKEIAVEAPRISLVTEVSKLNEIRRRTSLLSEWPETFCGYRLEERVLFAEAFDVEWLKDFMGGSNEGRARESQEAWNDVERDLKAIRAMIRATR